MANKQQLFSDPNHWLFVITDVSCWYDGSVLPAYRVEARNYFITHYRLKKGDLDYKFTCFGAKQNHEVQIN